MSETDILWGEAETLQQLFGQTVRELEPADAPEIILEIGPLVPITLIGDRSDDTGFDNLLISF